MKYLSKYSNGKMVSAAQYITEIICEHLATKEKRDLHYRFWLNKDWEKFYKSQICSANKLLQKYEDRAIVAALKTPKGQKIYSLRAPYLTAMIEEQTKILSSQNTKLTQSINRSVDSSGKNTQQKLNILDKLKEIDNEH